MRAVFLGLLLCALLPGLASAQERRVRVPRERFLRGVEASAASRVTVISASGVDTARVSDQGLQLAPRTMAALRTTDLLKAVPGPVAPAGAGPNVTSPAEPSQSSDPFVALPFRLLTPDATATGTWVLRPVYKVATRLRWQPDSAVFRGSIYLAVEDSLRRSESKPLPTPVRFQLLGDADRVDPANIELSHTNFPLQRIDLVARRVSDSLRVQIVPEFDVRGIDVWIPVEPSLIVESTPHRIQGWGVGNARVTVRVIGASARAPAAVTLHASDGELDSTAVSLGAAGSASTRLRSAGTGPVTITASAPGFNEAQTTLEFVWPLGFFAAALLGGIFGGLGAAVQHRKGRAKTRWKEFAIKGVFAGLLAAVVWYALGVNLLQFNPGMPRFNELAVFAFAALAGYFGIPRMGGAKEQPA